MPTTARAARPATTSVVSISRYVYLLDNIVALLADSATDSKQKAICAFCHPNPGGAGHNVDSGASGRT
jgi:hypothetical protein